MISCPKFCDLLIECCLGSRRNQVFPKRTPTSLHTIGRAQSTTTTNIDSWQKNRENEEMKK